MMKLKDKVINNVRKLGLVGLIGATMVTNAQPAQSPYIDLFEINDVQLDARKNALDADMIWWLKRDCQKSLGMIVSGLRSSEPFYYVFGASENLTNEFQQAGAFFKPLSDTELFIVDKSVKDDHQSVFWTLEGISCPTFNWSIEDYASLKQKTNISVSASTSLDSFVTQNNIILDKKDICEGYSNSISFNLDPSKYGQYGRLLTDLIKIERNFTRIPSLKEVTFSDSKIVYFDMDIGPANDNNPYVLAENNQYPTWNLISNLPGEHNVTVTAASHDENGGSSTNVIYSGSIYPDNYGLMSIQVDRSVIPNAAGLENIEMNVSAPKTNDTGEVSIESFKLLSWPHRVYRDGKTIFAAEKIERLLGKNNSDSIIAYMGASASAYSDMVNMSYSGTYSVNQGVSDRSPVYINDSQSRVDWGILSPLSNGLYTAQYVANGVFAGEGDPLGMFGAEDNIQDMPGMVHFAVSGARKTDLDGLTSQINYCEKAVNGGGFYGCTIVREDQFPSWLIHSFGIPTGDEYTYEMNGAFATKLRIPLILAGGIVIDGISAFTDWLGPSRPPIYEAYNANVPFIVNKFIITAGCPEATSDYRLPNVSHTTRHINPSIPVSPPVVVGPTNTTSSLQYDSTGRTLSRFSGTNDLTYKVTDKSINSYNYESGVLNIPYYSFKSK